MKLSRAGQRADSKPTVGTFETDSDWDLALTGSLALLFDLTSEHLRDTLVDTQHEAELLVLASGRVGHVRDREGVRLPKEPGRAKELRSPATRRPRDQGYSSVAETGDIPESQVSVLTGLPVSSRKRYSELDRAGNDRSLRLDEGLADDQPRVDDTRDMPPEADQALENPNGGCSVNPGLIDRAV